MKSTILYIGRKFSYVLVLLALIGCDPDIDEFIGSGDNIYSAIYGEVQLSFPIDDRHVPQRCIKRADLSIAYTADSLYRKEFLTVANVSNYQSLYAFHLEPGFYYYQAGKTCICGGDTCLWGGYPGGQNGMRWTMAAFEIQSGIIVYDRITFD